MLRFQVNVPLTLLALVCFSLSPSARADCREGCDASLKNTFFGSDALMNNTSGDRNTATGHLALTANMTGLGNTANGAEALSKNTTGHVNTAVGNAALGLNTTGIRNTATGADALARNSDGRENTAEGYQTLFSNTTGIQNTANGVGTLFNNITGSNNTASGFAALFHNTTGSNNIAVGGLAGLNLTTGNNNIDIGNEGSADEANTIRIGAPTTHTATFVAGIRGVAITDGQPIGVSANGQLGVRPSSLRFKEAIKQMDNTSAVILSLRPVAFRYKKELDPRGTQQFGLIAEEVAKVNPDLVVSDEQGKPFTVRYDEVNAMLLNEFLKEHRKVETLEATVARLAATVEEQAAQIQKVNAKLELSKPALATAVNNQ